MPSSGAVGTRAACSRRTSCSPQGGRLMADAVSVVIPTRNRSRLVVSSVRLVLEQQCVELEVIVVDDGSRDGAAEAVAAIGDPRVTVLRNDERRGVAHARNRGL